MMKLKFDRPILAPSKSWLEISVFVPKQRVVRRQFEPTKKICTIAGRLVRELDRQLPAESIFREKLTLFTKVLQQKRSDKNKVYSLHDTDVQCISKGKERKKYKFGNKVSIVCSIRGVILCATSFRNPYDGHTIDESLAQIERPTGKTPRLLAGDRGYRGQMQSNDNQIVISTTPLSRF